ncbi:NUDIX hydrolase [Acidicapsa ligni]|uniref:NUDIX hydrolase n=1 Tax=Acidicapsa ligni TaxID=542300 RepID=UPI0021E0E2A4|nr:NUDIX hydrolase [Acidicapsa ligni]
MTQREYPATPLVGVGGVVFDFEGRVLLIRRGTEPRKGLWSIPGGLVELGESLTDALKREIAEESGLIVEPVAIIEVVDRIYTDESAQGGRVRFHYVIVDYLCRIVGGEAKAGDDAAEISWADRAEWNRTNLYGLESITVKVIENGWKMAYASGESA